ncbi:MAG: glycosyltransferase [Clostridiales bacterium]|nr:glycosyltransferase [Clostridiales bacterium]
MNSPVLSVIIPVYNAQECLPTALKSVFEQGINDIEIILINDGSRDNSLQVCKEYALQDPRVIVLDQQNSGPGAARNAGLTIARGEYISFVDSDDYLMPGSYEKFLEAAKRHHPDLLIAHFNIIMNGRVIDRGYVKTDQTMDKEAFLHTLAHRPGSYYYSALWNKLYRRQVLLDHQLMFDKTYHWGEDFDFNMRFYHHVQKVSFIKEPIYNYERTYSGQTWRSMFKLDESFKIKSRLYTQLKLLYQKAGLLGKYRLYIYRYIFNVTIST